MVYSDLKLSGSNADCIWFIFRKFKMWKLLKGKLRHWDINNEMLHGNFFTEKTGNKDVRIKMFQKAKQLDPDALRFVNDYNVLLYETDAYVINFFFCRQF